MHSFSEIEIAFVIDRISLQVFIDACSAIRDEGFDIDIDCPGYTMEEVIQFADWTSIEDVYDQVDFSTQNKIGVNFSNAEFIYKFSRVSLILDLNEKSISYKLGEEEIVDTKSNKICKKSLSELLKISEKLAERLDFFAWKIGQTGFNYSCMKSSFILSNNIKKYPETDILKTVSWYENEYLLRWQ